MNCRSGKIRFESPALAANAAKATAKNRSDGSRKQRAGWARGPLQHYRCPWCKGWHIGHGDGKREATR